MKKVMFRITGILLLCLVASCIAWQRAEQPWILSAVITFATAFYHFAMRLIVGHTIHGCFHNQMHWDRWWFHQKKLEADLYRFLGVRKWKKHIPTYDAASFDLKSATLEQTLGATCQAEIVHEVIILLSFLPVLTVPWLGEPVVFWCTSAAAALFDSVFVILQRYNRPRLVKLLQRTKRIR